METRERFALSQMALELAELSRLDMASNFKDWRRTVIEAVRTRPSAPVRVPEDWAFEIQIALNALLMPCVCESHGRRAMLLVRHAFEQVLLEQVATTGASFELLERVEFLQAVRFTALFALICQADVEPRGRTLCQRLASDIVRREAIGAAGSAPLAESFEEFRTAMLKRVASYTPAEAGAPRA